jgi:long-chain acyl-CoA synthetase
MNLAETLANVARSVPDNPAVVAGERTMSYRNLMETVAGLAGGLRDRFGLAPGDRVAVFMENAYAFYPVLFACWRAGLSVVPINAKLHVRELHWIVENAGAKLLVLSEKSATLAASDTTLSWPATLIADTPDYDTLTRHELAPQHDGATTDEAWLFYTSGTTGRPKGAILSHRSLYFMCHAYYADIDHLTPDDSALHAAPLTHGSGLYGLATTLKGGRNVILDGFEPSAVLAAIAQHPSVSMFAAPTMITRLLDHAGLDSADLTNLRTITYGGAPMYVADLKRALAAFGPRLYQLYGQGESPMTITGLAKSAHLKTADEAGWDAVLGSTGMARTGVAVRILREDGSEANTGEVGEIVTKSDALMTGYLDNPEATARAIREGWLWTGDMGALDDRGYLTIKDRSKDMIISGGTNIYPREIEEVLLTHPDVVECAVAGRPHADWGEEVVAFVVRRQDSNLAESDLDALCLANIARFKRPKAYRFVASLPKNNYGKVLKTELRQMMADD